jgi:hypothetical protein
MNARGASAYLEGAVRRAVETVASTPPGDRNATVNREAHSLGGLLAQGLPRGPVEAALVAAAVAAGLSEREARYTVRGALDDGERNPRPLPRGVSTGGRLPSIAPPAPPAPRHTPPADPVHASEARDVWAQSVRPGGGGEAARELWFWLESRHLDPFVVAERDLIRALPAGPLPGWCEEWREDGRAVLPVFDASGELVTLRGRWTFGPAKGPKTRAAGGEGSATARVYACPVARRMLAGEGEGVAGVVVTEGDPDFLTLASWWPSGWRVAVLGVWAGAIVPALLDRIPDGAPVLLCPHKDASGQGYMRAAAAPVLNRCPVYSLRYDGQRDVNDSLQAGRLEARLTKHFDKVNA